MQYPVQERHREHPAGPGGASGCPAPSKASPARGPVSLTNYTLLDKPCAHPHGPCTNNTHCHLPWEHWGKGGDATIQGNHGHCHVMIKTLHILMALGLAWRPGGLCPGRGQTPDSKTSNSSPEPFIPILRRQALVKTLLSPKQFNI